LSGLKRYLNKQSLSERYDGCTKRTVDRWVDEGILPRPVFYRGRQPYWDADELDHHDQLAAARRDADEQEFREASIKAGQSPQAIAGRIETWRRKREAKKAAAKAKQASPEAAAP